MQTIFFFKTVVQTIFFLIFLPADNFFYQIRYPPVRKIMVRPLVKLFLCGVVSIEISMGRWSLPGMCEHRFCSQTKTIGDRNCTACFSLANIFN